MITFNYLSEIRRKEKNSNDLALLPENFFKEVEDFFNFTSDVDTKKQAQVLFKDLLQMRAIKIAQRAILFEKEDATNVHEREIQIYREMKILFNNLLDNSLSSQKNKIVLVKFNKDCEAFLGSDLKPYGPFKKEDLTTIPTEQALTLKQQNFVYLID